MTLPEDDESVFENLVDWLYRGRYEIPSQGEVVDIFLRPVQLFVLAEKYEMSDLRSVVLYQIFNLIKSETAETASLETVAYTYKHTSENAAIRKLLLDDMVWHCQHNSYQPPENRMWLRDHPEISADVIVRFAKRAGTQRSPFSGGMPKEYMIYGPKEVTGGDKKPLRLKEDTGGDKKLLRLKEDTGGDKELLS